MSKEQTQQQRRRPVHQSLIEGATQGLAIGFVLYVILSITGADVCLIAGAT